MIDLPEGLTAEPHPDFEGVLVLTWVDLLVYMAIVILSLHLFRKFCRRGWRGLTAGNAKPALKEE